MNKPSVNNMNQFNNKIMKKRLSFKWLFFKYEEAFEYRQSTLIHLIDKCYSLVGTAYYNLDINKIKELNYNQKRISYELFSTCKKRIKELILENIEKNRTYPTFLIKLILNDTYSKLSIEKKAKATDLNILFKVEICFKNDNNGKTTRCMTILE